MVIAIHIKPLKVQRSGLMENVKVKFRFYLGAQKTFIK